jgi:hypothetical protein
LFRVTIALLVTYIFPQELSTFSISRHSFRTNIVGFQCAPFRSPQYPSTILLSAPSSFVQSNVREYAPKVSNLIRRAVENFERESNRPKHCRLGRCIIGARRLLWYPCRGWSLWKKCMKCCPPLTIRVSVELATNHCIVQC